MITFFFCLLSGYMFYMGYFLNYKPEISYISAIIFGFIAFFVYIYESLNNIETENNKELRERLYYYHQILNGKNKK